MPLVEAKAQVEDWRRRFTAVLTETSLGVIYRFKVKIDWGTFDIYGEPLLRIRLNRLAL